MVDLDRILALMVGWRESDGTDGYLSGMWCDPALGATSQHPTYSHDIAACFGELVPWLADKGWWLVCRTSLVSLDKCFARFVPYDWSEELTLTNCSAFAGTPEMAIALAAEAVGKVEGWIKE